jgi:hypothetical protein
MADAAQIDDPYVNVPGQVVGHTHTCKCGHSWTHKAPIPMRASVNEKIHTCVMCGYRVPNFTFSYFDDPYVVLGAMAVGVFIWWMFSRWMTR